MGLLNIILNNCAVSNGNRGCVALSVSTMYLIDELLRSHNIEYKFYLPQSGHTKPGEYSITVGDRTLRYTAVKDYTDNGLKTKLKNLVKYSDYSKARNVYRSADYILDIGHGDSFADIYGKRRFETIYASYQKAMAHNKKMCILPQTIGPFDDPTIREKAIKGIDSANLVMVRDRQSLDYIKQLSPKREVSEIIDVAFFMPYVRKNFDKAYTHIGLNISALLWNGGYNGNNQFGLKDDYKKLITSTIEYLLTLDKVKVHLIPHVFDTERTVENDYSVSYDIKEAFDNDNIILAPFFMDPMAAKGYIAGMDMFIGARMHATIGAFSSGVPVVPMAYSRKFNGLFADTLDYPYLADLRKSDNAEALKVIKDAYAKRNELKQIIEHRMETIVKERHQLLNQKLTEFFGL